MKKLQENKIDALITASLYINVIKEAESFMNIDVSTIVDTQQNKKKVLFKTQRFQNGARFYPIRVAAIASLIIISMIFTACMCIPEVRKSMWNAFVDWYDDHIDVYFIQEIDENTTAENLESLNKTPSSIEKKAYASFLPYGYYSVENESMVLYNDTFYYDSDGNMKFRLLQRVIDGESDSDVMVDYENDLLVTVYIKNYEGILVEYPDMQGLYYLVWQASDYQYSIYGSFTTTEELIKIAEGITTE